MKYGIMTYHNIPNFGAVLQAYSLCMSVKKLGYDCEIIDYRCENINKREIEFKKSGNLLKDCLKRLFVWPKDVKKIYQCAEFNKHLFSARAYDRNSISSCNDIYDGFISGSDMIWNLDVNGYDYSFFLDFISDDKKRIAYGSSIGSCWKNDDLATVKPLLEKYSYIGVREKDTCDIISGLGLKAVHVVDPTMLLLPSEWDSFTSSVNDKDYVFVYFPSEKLVEKAKEYCNKHNKKLVILGNKLPLKNKNHVMLYSPNEWISYIKYADAIFTDSYHGLLFSLFFEKPVWTLNKSNRVISLLNALGLAKVDLDNDGAMNTTIDYERCRTQISAMRAASLEFLQKELQNVH